MAAFPWSRRSTDSSHDNLRDRFLCFSSRISNASSGSEHDADLSPSSSSSSSTCLSYLVQNFLEHGDGVSAADPSNSAKENGNSDSGYLASDPAELIRDIINPIVRNNGDRFRTELLFHVSRATNSRSATGRSVMACLRQIGYNAGLCKTKWEVTGNLAAGSYEFIDVVRTPASPVSFSEDPDSRYVIDLDFAGQFEIARATESYQRLHAALPSVLVAKSSDVKRIVKLMADETRRSMKINEMSLSPWRKNRYMQAKWFGPYKRTVNQSATAITPHQSSVSAVKCRSVGFCAAAVAPPTTRTR